MSIPLIPVPNHLENRGGAAFALSGETKIFADPDSQAAVELFVTQLRRATGFDLEVQPLTANDAGGGAVDGAIVFRVDPEANYADGSGNAEAYRVEVSAVSVSVTGASAHGVFNATQTLRQLLPAAVEAEQVLADWQLPAVDIVDWPEFEYRGLMIDVARSFLTVEEIERIIDFATLAKISRLHLHLSDDQGWRIEITNEGRVDGDTIDYTQLTAVSGATAMTQWGHNGEPGRTGFYTQADYQRIVDYAAQRHVVVIPEIDLPGHTIGALAAIPELNTAGACHEGTEAQPVSPPDGSGDVGHSYLDPHSEHTYTFARHVLRQLARITPGEYVHIGGDEPLKMTERHGHEVYIECVGRIVEIVREVGKKPAGWNEISEVKAGPDMIVQFWQGESTHTIRAAEEGAKILLSRGESAYLDQKYHPEFPIGLDWACKGDCDFPRYYEWEPTQLVPELTHDQIAGVEAPLWSETLRGVSQIFLMAFPRLFAAAELGWSAPHTRSLEGFTTRLAALAPRLLLGGGNFYDGEKAAWQPVVAGLDTSGSSDGDSSAAGDNGSLRVARVAAPGGFIPEVTVEIDGRSLIPKTDVIQDRGPLHAGPVFDVIIDGDGLESGSSGRVHVGSESAPIKVH